MLLLSAFRSQEHQHLSALKLCGLFNRCAVCTGLRRALHNNIAELGVSHFTASEADGNLDLVARRNELACVVNLCVKIVRIDVERKSDFFNLNGFLIFLCFFLFLRFFKSELAVVHNLADGRLCHGSNLIKVKISALCDFKSLRCGHDAELLAVIGNNSYFLVADFLIDLLLLLADVEAPPEN